MYKMNIENKIEPSTLEIKPLSDITNSKIVISKRKIPSLSKTVFSIESTAKNVATPRIKAMLAMFEPVTLPIIMSVLFTKAAAMEDESSGNEVPMATTVKPIRKFEMFNNLANFTILSMKILLPLIRKIIETTRISNSI